MALKEKTRVGFLRCCEEPAGLKIALLKEAAGYGFLAQADCCLLAELVVAFQNSSSRSKSTPWRNIFKVASRFKEF